MVMNNQYLQNPSVRLERLSPMVIEALRGHVVATKYRNAPVIAYIKYDNVVNVAASKSSESIPNTTIRSCFGEATRTVLSPKSGYKKKRPLKLLAQSTETKPNQPNINTNNVKALQVTLERLPKNIVNIITPKNVCKVKKQKGKLADPKNICAKVKTI